MIAESLLPEFDHEVKTTRTLLERVPEEHRDFKPHPKSMSLGQLAMHVGNLLHWAEVTLSGSEFDANPPGGEPAKAEPFSSTAALVERYDSLAVSARNAIASAPDEALLAPWSLKNGGHTIFTMPRVAVLRSFVMNHLIHHRGQLTVYLRLKDVPLPSVYGPTADM